MHEFALSLRNLLLRCVRIGARGFYGGGTGFGGSGGLIVLLLRNFLLLDQLLVADKIVLRLDVVGFSLLQLRFGGLELLLGGLYPGTRAVDVGFSR